MIDLHCHLLPGIDDGPADPRGSVALAEAAFNDGVEVIAATPHAREDHPAVVAPELAGRCEAIREELRVQEVPVRVVSGAEVDVAWALGASEQDLIDVTYGGLGRDVLVETPHGLLPPGFEDRLHDVFAPRGIRVLLAHPERSRVFQREPRKLARILERGVLAQVTANALMEGNRGAGAKLARAMVSEGVAHVIATDAHRPEARASLSDAVRALPRAEEARARWMVEDAPAAILAGERLPPLPQGRRHVLRKRFG
jgi:protein-tyrosine phosphatase